MALAPFWASFICAALVKHGKISAVFPQVNLNERESATSLGICSGMVADTGAININIITCFDQLRSTSWFFDPSWPAQNCRRFSCTHQMLILGQHCFRLATSCSCHRHLHIQSNQTIRCIQYVVTHWNTRPHESMKSNGEEIEDNTVALTPALNSGHLALQWAVPRPVQKLQRTGHIFSLAFLWEQ